MQGYDFCKRCMAQMIWRPALAREFPLRARDVAILSDAAWATWWDGCHYGIAVFVLTQDADSTKCVVYATAHLPAQSESDEAYNEAPQSLDGILSKLSAKNLLFY